MGERAGVASRVVALGSCVALGGFPIAGLKSIDPTPLKFDRINFGRAIGVRGAVGW
jgi:hypothetical protein